MSANTPQTGNTDSGEAAAARHAPDSATPAREELPLPDFDHIPLGTLSSRIHSLDERALTELIGWERAHGHRVPVLQVLESRIEQLRNGAEPSGTVPETMPEMTSNQGGSKVSQQTAVDNVPEPAKSSPMLPFTQQ